VPHILERELLLSYSIYISRFLLSKFGPLRLEEVTLPVFQPGDSAEDGAAVEDQGVRARGDRPAHRYLQPGKVDTETGRTKFSHTWAGTGCTPTPTG